MPDLFAIPVSSDEPSYKIRVDLEGIDYVLRFNFNERMNRWVMGIYDAEETPIILGIALVVNYSLLRIYTVEGMPPGEMILFDTSEKNQECGRNDLGNRCILVYENSV